MAPRPLTIRSTRSPLCSPSAPRSDRAAPVASSLAGAWGRRPTPRSPWMPTPSSISPVAEVEGRPTLAGMRRGVQRDRHRARAGGDAPSELRDLAAAWRRAPAAAPQIFSTAITAAVPRRPGPSSLSVATSSSTSTDSTSAAGHLGRHAEVHDVAGVILDDVDDPVPRSIAAVAASTWSAVGLAKMPPGTAASSIPRPTKPVCSGSCPSRRRRARRPDRAVVVGAHDEARLAVPAHERGGALARSPRAPR